MAVVRGTKKTTSKLPSKKMGEPRSQHQEVIKSGRKAHLKSNNLRNYILTLFDRDRRHSEKKILDEAFDNIRERMANEDTRTQKEAVDQVLNLVKISMIQTKAYDDEKPDVLTEAIKNGSQLKLVINSPTPDKSAMIEVSSE